jgi:hypothetical protein
MMGFRLHLKQLPDGRLIFTIPLGYKLLLFFIGLLIFASLIITRQEDSGSIFIRENTIPLIVCLLCFLGAAYHESWIFDRARDQVVHQHGISALHSNKVYRVTDLERIEISQFVRGKAGGSQGAKRSIAFRPIVTLSLQTKDGNNFRLENYRASQRSRVETTASKIAEYCGISCVNDIQGSDELDRR